MDIERAEAFETVHSDVGGEHASAGSRFPAETRLCVRRSETRQPVFIGSFGSGSSATGDGIHRG